MDEDDGSSQVHWLLQMPPLGHCCDSPQDHAHHFAFLLWWLCGLCIPMVELGDMEEALPPLSSSEVAFEPLLSGKENAALGMSGPCGSLCAMHI